MAGDARIAVLAAAGGVELDAFLKTNLAADSHLLTDGFASYRSSHSDLAAHLKHTLVVEAQPGNAGECFPIADTLFGNNCLWLRVPWFKCRDRSIEIVPHRSRNATCVVIHWRGGRSPRSSGHD